MTTASVLRTRLTVCARCGHRDRVVVDADAFVLSRCHACGDESRVIRAVEATVRPAATPPARVPVAQYQRVGAASGKASAEQP